MFNFLDKISKFSLPKQLPTEIICGDCSGDALLPIRTNVTSDGRCAVCDGRSYVMAAELVQSLARHIQIKNLEKEQELYEQHKHIEYRSTSDCIEVESELRN